MSDATNDPINAPALTIKNGIRPTPAQALSIARDVAGEAATLLRDAAGTATDIRSKSNSRDLVTEWDTRIEALIRTRLHACTPEIPLLGEEGGASTGRAHEDDRDGPSDVDTNDGDRWLVDPIDGTVNFSHGLPHFSVVIALERARQPIAGVVIAPALGWEFYGHVGGGAYRNGKRLQVSAIDNLDASLLASGFPYDRADNPANNFAQWERFLRRAGGGRRFGSASLDLCMVASGWLDGYWERRLHPWDLSAGALFVREAGGHTSAYNGSMFISEHGELVASNGRIHDAMLRELADVAREAMGPGADD